MGGGRGSGEGLQVTQSFVRDTSLREKPRLHGGNRPPLHSAPGASSMSQTQESESGGRGTLERIWWSDSGLGVRWAGCGADVGLSLWTPAVGC